MKKILALLITALTIFSILGASAYATSDYEAELLSALSIMQGDPDGNMRYNDKVSRAECAKIVVAASQYRDYVNTDVKNSPFMDVTASHWAAPYITVGVKNGLFKGYFDATFRPSNTVLFEEAVTMLLRVLDYTDADVGADWPYDQIDMAKKIGMLDDVNISIGKELTRRDISTLVYNTLNSTAKGAQNTYLSNFNRIIGPKTVTSSNWYEEFGADSNIRVMRNGVKSTVSEVAINDIAYYMEEYKTALIYSKTATGIYENATPSKDAPTSVTVSGVTYSIEGDNAYYKLSSAGTFNYGDTVTLLLGKTGGVADVLAGSSSDDTVYGFLIGTGTKETTFSGNTTTKPFVRLVLSSGNTAEYITTKNYSDYLNRVVAVTLEKETATVSLSSSQNKVSGKFTWTSSDKKLGETPISADVKIIEVSSTASNDTAIYGTVFPQRLNSVNLSSSDVLYANKNQDGKIDELILLDVTGDIYTYAILTKATNNNLPGIALSGSYEYISNGTHYTAMTSNKIFGVSAGEAVKIVSAGAKGITSMSSLAKAATGKITSVSGVEITISEKTYTMSDKVQIYIKNQSDYTMVALNELSNLKDSYNAAIYTDKKSSIDRVRIIVLS